jgi:heat shock protein HslJ
MGTKMACPGGMGTETAFLTALGQVQTWRVLGRLLELQDAQGNLLARFEARSATK